MTVKILLIILVCLVVLLGVAIIWWKESGDNWYAVDVCVVCNKKLTSSHKMYNDGICPYCGHNSHCTVCDTVEVTVSKVKTGKWWEFWKYEMEGKDEFSKNWLKEQL